MRHGAELVSGVEVKQKNEWCTWASALFGCVSKNGKLFLLAPNKSVGRQGLCFPIFIETPESFGHEGNNIAQRKGF